MALDIPHARPRHQGTPGIEEALAFDDVLVVPAYSQVLPSSTSTVTRLTRGITLNIPLISAAMDTVTEAEMAIAMAQLGGMGVIHKNMEPAEQAAQVRRVKKFESGMVVNPLTIHPDQTLADVKLADDNPPHQRHPGGRARHQPPGRHRHQPRRPLRHRSEPARSTS